MGLCLNVEPQTGNPKPRLEVRSKLGSKTLYSVENAKREKYWFCKEQS